MTLNRACLLAASLAAATMAHAQNTPTPTADDDTSLSWKGLTLYGAVDIGYQYQTHGAPSSDYFPAGTEAPIQKNSSGSVSALTPSNLSQSRIGLAGNEPLGFGDWSGIFRVETFFNPQSGDLSDGLKSLTQNSGKALKDQSTNVDTSVAGQIFQGAAYAGLSSGTFGSLTFGRHPTLLADGITKYDPFNASQAFSLIGWSGTAAGGGDTEDRRLDQSLKYQVKYDWLHFGALYQFSGASGSTNTAVQATLGAEYLGGSVDAYYAKKYDAVSAATLSAKQVGELATNCVASAGANCYSVSNALSGTISDNTTYGVMATYNFGAPVPQLFAGYEHIKFANPNTPYAPGQLIIGGYVLGFVNNTAYDDQKILQVFWAGIKWPVLPQLDLIAAYYGYKQNSYATGKDAGCSSATVAGSCSGTENAASIALDYKFTKRFDVYLGTFWSEVQDGLANDFLNTSTVTTTVGARFRF